MDGLGATLVWGLSPARGLVGGGEDGAEPVRVLVVDGGDVRHVLRTVAEQPIGARPVHFYLMERKTETLARHLLLLQLLLDSAWDVPWRERAETFLEVYGNCQLRERTEQVVEEQANKLVELLAKGTGALADVADVELLKFKERDELEERIRSWRRKHAFDIGKLRDERLRGYYKDRYDSREGVIDWDYHMKLAEIGRCSVIPLQHFVHWRLTGNAFGVRDSVYVAPNRTLASWVEGKEGGRSVERRGFWSDVVLGPYIGFGVDARNEALFDKNAKTTAQDVSVYNVLAFYYQIMTGKRASAGADPEEALAADQPSGRAAVPFKVHLLQGQPDALARKSKFAGLFDVVYLGMTAAGHINEGLRAVMAPQCTVIAETARYVIEIKSEQRAEFARTLIQRGTDAGWTADLGDSDEVGSADAVVFRVGKAQ